MKPALFTCPLFRSRRSRRSREGEQGI